MPQGHHRAIPAKVKCPQTESRPRPGPAGAQHRSARGLEVEDCIDLYFGLWQWTITSYRRGGIIGRNA